MCVYVTVAPLAAPLPLAAWIRRGQSQGGVRVGVGVRVTGSRGQLAHTPPQQLPVALCQDVRCGEHTDSGGDTSVSVLPDMCMWGLCQSQSHSNRERTLKVVCAAA
eukprot:357425-Chlamydomonas_euryale.AAC.6